MHSIRLKMAMLIIAAIMTSILALGCIWIFTIGAESDRNAAEKMNLISSNTQMEMDSYFDSIEQSVHMAIRMANDSLNHPDIVYLGKSGSPEQVEKLDAALRVHIEEVRHAFSSIANSTTGVASYYYCINADYGSTELGFLWSRIGETEFVEQTPPDSAGLDRNDMEHNTWYFTALREAAPAWVGPYKARDMEDQWVISYVTPIYHSGFIVGVLGMDILFDTIEVLADDVQVYDTGFAFLMDRDGYVLYHPEMEMSTDLVLFDQSLTREVLRRRSSGDVPIRYTRNGETWLLAFSALNNNFKAAVTAPVSEITAYRRQLTVIIGMVALLILVVFTLLTVLIVNRMTRPLLLLTSASERLMAGDYDVTLAYDGKDEIGILTRAFRQMRDHMKLYINDLSHRANTDAMTGVKNKGSFNAMAAEIDQQIQSGEVSPAFGIIMMDCNGLKKINDAYGHMSGDVFLKKACTLICRVFEHSPVFRMGGDEFVVLLREGEYEKRDQLLREFDRRADEINASAMKPWEKIDLAKGISIYRPGEDQNVNQVYLRADERMYQDKRKKYPVSASGKSGR